MPITVIRHPPGAAPREGKRRRFVYDGLRHSQFQDFFAVERITRD